jgi:hypothetical protein
MTAPAAIETRAGKSGSGVGVPMKGTTAVPNPMMIGGPGSDLAIPLDPNRHGEPFWKSTLSWLPPEASLFGAVNLTGGQTVTLDDDRIQTVLNFLVPAKARNQLTPENLGRIRLDRLSLAYYDDLKPDKSGAIVQVEGLALDGHKRIVDSLSRWPDGKVQVERKRQSQLPSQPDVVRISSPELPFALGIYDDNHFFLAASTDKNAKEREHVKVLERQWWFNFASGGSSPATLISGYNPPWVKAALGAIPSDACCILMGEIPAQARKELTKALSLRVCPRTFVFYLQPQDKGFVMSLSLYVDKAGDDLLLQADLDKWRRQALDRLKVDYPQLRKEPGALAVVAQVVQNMRWGAKDRRVQTNVKISGTTCQALGKLLKIVSQTQAR